MSKLTIDKLKLLYLIIFISKKKIIKCYILKYLIMIFFFVYIKQNKIFSNVHNIICLFDIRKSFEKYTLAIDDKYLINNKKKKM